MTTVSTVPTEKARLSARLPNGQRFQIMHQRWESLLFLHWRIAPAQIQATLPPGLTVDTFDGDAYLGITVFFMRNVRPVGLPALPWISFFQELNVRTYAFDRTGTPGVWFYSLDCDRAAAALVARLIAGLPYFVADMSAKRKEWIDYECRRLGCNQTAQYRYRPAGPDREAATDSLEFFLMERYYLFAYRRSGGTLFRGQVSHVPYRYRDVELSLLSDIPARLDGFRNLDDSPDHVCVCDGFDVKIFAQEKI